MNELKCQGLAVAAVNKAGGFAYKMSHRFLVGVVDLFVKLPDCNAMMIEAKFHRLSPKAHDDVTWDLGVTAPQRRFLERAHKAGITTGVVSFLYIGRSLHSCMYTANAGHGRKGDHQPLDLVELFQGWAS